MGNVLDKLNRVESEREALLDEVFERVERHERALLGLLSVLETKKMDAAATTVPCRGCGMKIEFVTTPNGKQIPLQRVRTVYAMENGAATRLSLAGVYISHFETCPKADSFSRKGK
jgi:hypothetical protein